MRSSIIDKDSEGIRKKPRVLEESSGVHHKSMLSAGQPGTALPGGEASDPRCNGASATVPTCNSSARPIHVRDVLELITSVIGCFNETNRNMLATKLARMELVYDSDKDLLEMLVSFESIFKSPYAHFVSNTIYTTIFRVISCKIKSCNQVKTMGLTLLLEHYDPLRVFQDMADAYSVLDIFKVGKRSFRNHALYRSIFKVYEETLVEQNTGYGAILDCAESIRTCVPFAEFLSRNAEDFLCRDLMIVYSYSFLSRIPVDLAGVKRASDLKDVDDPAISRIFSVFHNIRMSYHRQSKCAGQLESGLRDCNSGAERSSLAESKSTCPVGKHNTECEGIDVHRGSEAFNIDAGSDHRSVVPSAMASRSEEMLKALFGSESINSIILTVYKRLFNYFLFKNKRMLAGIKVPRIFTKKEKGFIFRHLRSSTQSFSNVFKQLDQSYILRLLSKSCAHDTCFPLLLESIREDCLGKSDLVRFYSFYIDFLEFARRPVKMKMRNIETFSTVFNNRIDKSFSRFIVFHRPVTEFSSRSVIEMLAHYTTTCEHTGCGTTGMSVDIVELASLMVDSPQKLFVKASTRYYNDVLKILANMSSRFSIGLVCRVVPVLRQLVFCKDYALSSGRLYRKLHGQFGFQDDVFATGASSTHRLVLMAKGAVGHSTFEACFASTAGEVCRPRTDKEQITGLSEGIVDHALVFYLHYKPSFALEHCDMLQRILQKRNSSTLYLLEYLREYISRSALALGKSAAADLADECEGLFTFISSNIGCLYNLYNSDVTGSHSSLRTIPNHNPFVGVILGILLDSLKTRAILPHMAIPYLMPKADCSYLYRNHIDSCVNCINDALYLVASRIRGLIILHKDGNGVSDAHNEDSPDKADDCNDISEGVLGELFGRELSVMFLYSIYKHSSLERILDKISHQDDMLLAFIILRNLRPFPSRERETFIRHIEKNTSDERIFDLMERSREFYRKSPKSVLPAHFIAS